MMPIPVDRRIWRFIDAAGPCWLWLGFCDRGGYGKISVLGRPQLAHRVVYEHLVGAIPDRRIYHGRFQP